MSVKDLDRVRVVLVDTSHPGNIGAVARAMRTMGLTRLALVRPKDFPSAEATARAAGADELLYDAAVFESLDDALAECVWVVGTTVRSRHLELPRLDPRGFAERALLESAAGPVALVFGREQTGLSNEELDRCQAIASIDTDPKFGSLNLAAAAQVFCYELRLAFAGRAPESDVTACEITDAATSAELEGLYAHLERTLTDIGYYDPEHPKLLMRRLRQLYARAQPDRSELNILRGILAATQRASAKSRGD